MKKIVFYTMIVLSVIIISTLIGHFSPHSTAKENKLLKSEQIPREALKVTLPEGIDKEKFKKNQLSKEEKDLFIKAVNEANKKKAEKDLSIVFSQRNMTEEEKAKAISEVDSVVYLDDGDGNILNYSGAETSASTTGNPEENNLTISFVPNEWARDNWGQVDMPLELQNIIQSTFNEGYPVLKQYLGAPYNNITISVTCNGPTVTNGPQFNPHDITPYITLGTCIDSTGGVRSDWRNDNFFFPKRAFLHELVHAFENTAGIYGTSEGLSRILDGEVTRNLGYFSSGDFAPVNGLTGKTDYNFEQRTYYYLPQIHNMGVDFWWKIFNADQDIFKKFHDVWFNYCRQSEGCFTFEQPNPAITSYNLLKDIAPASIDGKTFDQYLDSVPIDDYALGVEDSNYAAWYKDFTIGLTSFPNTSITAIFYPYTNKAETAYWENEHKKVKISAYNVDDQFIASTDLTSIDNYFEVFLYSDFGQELTNYQGIVKFTAEVTDDKGHRWQSNTYGVNNNAIDNNVGIAGFISDTTEKQGSVHLESMTTSETLTVPVMNKSFVVPNSWNNWTGKLKLTYTAGSYNKEKIIYKSDHQFRNGVRGSFNPIWFKGANDTAAPELTNILIQQIPLPNCNTITSHNYELRASANEDAMVWIEPVAGYKSFFSIGQEIKTVSQVAVANISSQTFQIKALDRFGNIRTYDNVPLDITNVSLEKLASHKEATSRETIRYELIPHGSCRAMRSTATITDYLPSGLGLPFNISQKGNYNDSTNTISWILSSTGSNNYLPLVFEAIVN